ncbi:MAG: Eco57I restriction-modification methylase domain-containing protein [Propionibacteriaceae bacterium]|jgi:adenine-specific DNA-methyltransferase|nr:Eco57I restriction-modification methylase domain-containing protein [Propionibacteriaceae bacterium]
MTAELLGQAEWIRVEATLGLSSSSQSDRGQFFTPDLAAKLIADLPATPSGAVIRVLDPGAGSGMLTAALVERAVREHWSSQIDVEAIEIDATLIPALRRTAEAAEAFARQNQVDVRVHVREADLIQLWSGIDAELTNDFDLVIMNPPYRKLAASSWQRMALGVLGWESPNLYAAFVALGVECLRDGGQLVAITPRSFANGPYFGQFRKKLLDEMAFDRLHTFESRSTVFSDTGVLQENIVFSATKNGKRNHVLITSSQGHRDHQVARTVDYAELVFPTDPEQFIRITTDGHDDDAVQFVSGMPSLLSTLGLSVSTGRVVDFRCRANLVPKPSDDSVPLVYPGNLRQGTIEWPKAIGKDQGFQLREESDHKALMPSGTYVVVKRFSSKEERRRIVAAVWNPEKNGNSAVAFENHLNVFHHDGHGLDPELAWGLCLWLNTSVIDRCFRTFSGHTQVNATDLRSMRYPDEVMLRALARGADHLPDQDDLDLLLEQIMWESVVA